VVSDKRQPAAALLLTMVSEDNHSQSQRPLRFSEWTAAVSSRCVVMPSVPVIKVYCCAVCISDNHSYVILEALLWRSLLHHSVVTASALPQSLGVKKVPDSGTHSHTCPSLILSSVTHKILMIKRYIVDALTKPPCKAMPRVLCKNSSKECLCCRFCTPFDRGNLSIIRLLELEFKHSHPSIKQALMNSDLTATLT
jgi:hypothetical protein